MPVNPPRKSSSATETEAKDLLFRLRRFLRRLLSIRHNADRNFTEQTILASIPFRGHTAWLLVFSVMVASVGLNINSVPVVIGAMLISPLMGPIMGMGYAIATNNIEVFKKSAYNFLVMVALSVLTSFLYFKITPIVARQQELLLRTSPTFFDVLIGFFGGLAGVVALTRKGFFNVISGVAIATALMPPLCTAGYGLAVHNVHYFSGAFYLFLINSFYIGLATFIIIKYLRFPLVKHLDSARRRLIVRLLYGLAVLVMIPSLLSTYTMYRRELFKQTARRFVDANLKFPGARVLKTDIKPDKKEIDVYFIGEIVPESQVAFWKQQLGRYPRLHNARLQVFQTADKRKEIEEALSKKLKGEMLEQFYRQTRQQLQAKEAEIQRLRDSLRLRQARENRFRIPYMQIRNEALTLFPQLREVEYAPVVHGAGSRIDTVPTFLLHWKPGLSPSFRRREEQRFVRWMKQRLRLDTLAVERLR